MLVKQWVQLPLFVLIKTGTLTQNKMQVYETKFYNLDKQQLKEDEASKLIAEGIAVNSTASLDLSGTEQMLLEILLKVPYYYGYTNKE